MITNVAWADADHTQYKVTTDAGGYTITKLAAGDSNRCYQHNDVDVFLETHEVGAFVDPVDYMAKMRGERDRLLAACDWTRCDDAPFSAEQKTAWATYRQDLRDMPQDNPITTKAEYAALEWPEAPE
jgi:hypothetical protein